MTSLFTRYSPGVKSWRKTASALKIWAFWLVRMTFMYPMISFRCAIDILSVLIGHKYSKLANNISLIFILKWRLLISTISSRHFQSHVSTDAPLAHDHLSRTVQAGPVLLCNRKVQPAKGKICSCVVHWSLTAVLLCSVRKQAVKKMETSPKREELKIEWKKNEAR